TSTPKEIPSSGTYTFTERTGVKSEAKISAANRDYYNVGEAVRYDRKLESDGHQWLSYVNYSGGRSYVAIAKLAAVPTPPAKETPAVTPAVTTTPKPATPASTTSTPKEIPSSGTYTFTERTGVKSEAKISAANRDYYNVGETVRYDRKLESDGHQWLSYVNYSGGRSYVAIAKLAAVPTPPAKEVAPTISTVTTKPSATVSAPTTTTSVTPAEETKVYTIQAGDSLQRIATRHGITVAQLKEWNNLSSNLIHPNNRLVVSKPAATSSTAAFKVSASPDVSLQNSFANRNDSKLWPAKAPELKNYKQSDVPLLSQNDPRWAYSEYGNDVSRTIWENGCAIVSLAMVDSYFKGEITNPTSVAEWAGLRHYVYGEGTAWTAFADFGKSYGYKVKEHRTDFNSAMKEIQNGSIGIVSVKGGKFANAGHLMVVRGFDDNKVFLNDPNENSRRNNSYKGHTPTDIKRDALNYWTFSR
ncbi:MAG: SH3 domain-containing protein, partial [Aerococcaceae bacterium]|nr:SH3 domain-containing protein [Aerococcaceae bacterium]